MTLQGIREQLIKQTGRYDLVNDRESGSFVDNGANYYITEGQQLLDNSTLIDKMYMRYQVDQSSGGYIIELKHCISVQEVWVNNADGDASRLTKKHLSWIKANYTDPIAEITQDAPLYYCIVPIALAPSQKTITSSNYSSTFTWNYEDIMFADEDDASTDHWEYKGLLIMPPVDETYTITVYGRFKSVLEADTDMSFWTVEAKQASIEAAKVFMEMANSNESGSLAAERNVERLLTKLDNSMIEEEIVDIDQMEG